MCSVMTRNERFMTNMARMDWIYMKRELIPSKLALEEQEQEAVGNTLHSKEDQVGLTHSACLKKCFLLEDFLEVEEATHI